MSKDSNVRLAQSGDEQGAGVGREVFKLLKNNVRSYAMYIVLVLIFIIFNFATNGDFLSAGNISNLINQTGYVAVLAIGMTLILIIRHIDLAVGFVAGFTGAIAAKLMFDYNLNPWLAVLVAILLGALVGLYQGTLVAYVGVPAFVTTLAGQFIFKGVLLLLTMGTGTIIVKSTTFNNIANGYIPDIPASLIGEHGLHILTIAIGVIGVALVIISQLKVRVKKQKYGFKVVSLPIFLLGLVVAAAVIMVIIFLLAGQNGIPWTAVIVGVLLLIYNFMLNKTALGRYIYGIGGNPEAAELSGVNVRKVTLLCFISMGTLAAIAGVLYTSRLQSATTNAGIGFELDAIASSYIGGVAVSGGVGKVTNTIVGALIIMSLTSGFLLLQVDIAYQYIAKGIIFIIAVAFDILSRKKRA